MNSDKREGLTATPTGGFFMDPRVQEISLQNGKCTQPEGKTTNTPFEQYILLM